MKAYIVRGQRKRNPRAIIVPSWVAYERTREKGEVRESPEGKKRERTALKIVRCPPGQAADRRCGIGIIGNFCVVGQQFLVRGRLWQPGETDDPNEKTSDGRQSLRGA